MIRRILSGILRRIPKKLFDFIKTLIKNNRWIDLNQIERTRALLFAEKLRLNFDEEIRKIIKNKRVMIVSKGLYSYTYFNAAYLNNMIALMFYALYQGCIPIIEINAHDKDSNKWEWYFKQPIETVFQGIDISDFKRMECTLENFCGPTFQTAFNIDSEEFEIWNCMYHKFAIFNDKVNKYIEEELFDLNIDENRLGVIIRGTDYTNLKPKGHPVQPDTEELLAVIEQKLKEGRYEYIYVATEEKQLYDMIANKFGESIVLSNKRFYYDQVYYDGNYQYIGEINFDRENDNYLKGLEYLSSMIILSKCGCIVGSNCGGTLMALLFTSERKDHVIIDKGYY